MDDQQTPKIMMISTHGYVAAEPEFGKPDTGGQVVYVLELSKCLARMGYEVDILTRQFEGQPAEEPVADGVRVLRFPCGGDDFIPKEVLCDSIPEWTENVLNYVGTHKLTYSFINSHYWDAGIAGQRLGETMNIPHFHTPHSIGAWKRDNMDGDPQELEAKYNFQRRIQEERDVYHKCDLVIATTPVQREILENGSYDLGQEQVAVIPPGYDDQRFFPVSDATRQTIKQDLELDGPIILALGRIAKNKGYDLLVRAMPVVFDRIPESRLVLAVGSTDPSPGEARQIDGLKQIARELGIEDRIIYRDYIPDEWLADYYRAANVFALCSRYEPFGMTAVEAMACGTPAVVTTEGGLWQQVQWGTEAIYANPFDPEAYGHAIANVLKYPEVAESLSRYGSEKARAVFTWTGIAQQVLALLDRSRDRRASPVANVDDASPDEDGPVASDQSPQASSSNEEHSWNAEACL